jgi:anthranilate phosphoribosyltransferase
MKEHRWTPADFGLATTPREALLVDGPEDSAAMIREVLAGKQGPPRDYVLANSAAALWTVGKVKSLAEGAKLAAEAVDTGAARDLLARWAELSNVT